MFKEFVLILALAGLCHGDSHPGPKRAVCFMEPNKVLGDMKDRVTGTVFFTEMDDDKVHVAIHLEGFDVNNTYTRHGFHVHAESDISESCKGAAGHYNPTGMTHGAPSDTVRHVGDLGNIDEDSDGKVKLNMTDSVIELHGDYSIIGKAVVVHEKTDDLGKGGDDGSLKTGNAGGRLACCVIEEYTDDASGSATWRGNTVLSATFMLIFLALWH